MKNFDFILFSVFSLFLIFSILETQAQYVLTPLDVSFDIATGTITNYSNEIEKDIIIPDNFGGVTVTAVGDGVFSAFDLTSVVFPSTITYIGKYAFEDNDLISVVIPASITSIEDEAFRYNNLTSVVIPSSVISIGELAFSRNSLTKIEIPNSVISIGAYSFSKNSLDTLIIPTSVTIIGVGAFSENDLKSITIPTSITTIPDNAFAFNLFTNIDLPTSITTIETSAFENNSLTGISIPSSVTNIGDNAFNNNSLSSIFISSSVTSIGAGAFNNNFLTNVDLPFSITSIGANAFNNNSLEKIILPFSINGYVSRWKDSGDADVISIEDFSLSYTATTISSLFPYTITYINNGGLHSNTTDTYTIETPDIVLTDASKEGYTFQGWFDNEDYTGTAISIIDNGSMGNLILYASFNINSYTVTFEDYDGTVLNIDDVNFGNTASAPIINPVRGGYTFTGWDADFDFITSNLTITAQYDLITSIKAENLSSIRIYPNPAKYQITIEGITDKTISIYNNVGVILKEITVISNKQVVDISNLTTGVYYIKTDSFVQQVVVSR